MDETPKKIIGSEINCFICSSQLQPKQRVRVFGSSTVDIAKLLNESLDIDCAVYLNSDPFICTKCYKRLLKFQKAADHIEEIKKELKALYLVHDQRRVKRLQRSDEEPAPAIKKQPTKATSVKSLDFTSEAIQDNRNTCNYSTLSSSVVALSPITRPQYCFNNSFQLLSTAFPVWSRSCQIVSSTPKTKQVSLQSKDPQQNQGKVKLTVEYPSKTVNKTLSSEFEALGKAIIHGPPSRIAKAILKCKEIRTEVLTQYFVLSLLK